MSIKGIAGSRSVNEFFTFKPEFFAADFNFNDLSNADQFLYRKYIVDTDNGQLSLLAAICGSQERFSALGRLRFERLGDNPTAEEMVALMQEFTISNGSVPFAYVLKQEKKKDGSLTNNYRVSERYWLDTEEKAQKRITGFLERQKRSQERAAAAEAAGKERTGEAFRVSFDLSQIA